MSARRLARAVVAAAIYIALGAYVHSGGGIGGIFGGVLFLFGLLLLICAAILILAQSIFRLWP